MAAHAPSMQAKVFPVISIREASSKDTEQHALCAAISREILERAGEHNGNNVRPFASIATKIQSARSEHPNLSPREAFEAFDIASFMPNAGTGNADGGGGSGAAAAAGASSTEAAAAAEGGDAEGEAHGAAAAAASSGTKAESGDTGAVSSASGAGVEGADAADAEPEAATTAEAADGGSGRAGSSAEAAQPESASGGGGEVPYDDTYVKPVRDSRNIKIQTRILNQHLVCTLCMGYFNDACTIIECLHTFCRGCIMRYFKESAICPQCEADLGTNPRDLVRTDRTLQSIVDKVFPQFVRAPPPKPEAPPSPGEKDGEEERPAKAPRGAGAATAAPPAAAAAAASSSSGGGGAAAPMEVPEEISFSLQEIESPNKPASAAKLEKPYLRTKALLTVMHLRKYLWRKMGLSESVPIEVLCRDQPLSATLTLNDIMRQVWVDEENDLVLHYRVG